MPSPTADYSFSFGGYVFGAGTTSPIISVDGLESLPDLRVQDDNRGYNDGMFSGRDFYAGRTLMIETLTLAGNGNSAQENFDLMQSAMLPQQTGTTELEFKLSPSDSLKIINARVRKRITKVDPEYTYGFIRSAWQLFCPDPRYYSATLKSASLPFSTSLNRDYNKVYPLVYNVPGGGTTLVQNDGNVVTYPTITINGPASAIVLRNGTTDQTMSFTCTLVYSDVLVVDLLNKTVTLNGQPARNFLAPLSEWIQANVGPNYFSMYAYGTIAGTTTATVTWRDAYI